MHVILTYKEMYVRKHETHIHDELFNQVQRVFDKYSFESTAGKVINMDGGHLELLQRDKLEVQDLNTIFGIMSCFSISQTNPEGGYIVTCKTVGRTLENASYSCTAVLEPKTFTIHSFEGWNSRMSEYGAISDEGLAQNFVSACVTTYENAVSSGGD